MNYATGRTPRMAPIAEDAAESTTVTHPMFEHGEDLFVLSHPDGLVEFHTAKLGQFITTDTVIDVRNAI